MGEAGAGGGEDRVTDVAARLALLERSQRRTEVLQRITGELAGASSDDEIAQIACAGAMASVEVTAGAVILMPEALVPGPTTTPDWLVGSNR